MVLGNHPEALALAADAQGVERLRRTLKNDPQGAIRETARQFEALLTNSLLRAMRETLPQDGVFDSDQTRLFTSLLDHQLAQSMSGRGFGLAEVLEKQLARATGSTPPEPWSPVAAGHASAQPWNRELPAASETEPAARQPFAAVQAVAPADRVVRKEPPGTRGAVDERTPRVYTREFIDGVLPHAEAASERTGIPVRFLIGQAALESGWGRYEIRREDGSRSHNLFGIKADRGWRGDTVEARTKEYDKGIEVRRTERFRAYASYDEAFLDYAAFLRENPRYASALEATHSARAFARELQAAGYATDPRYAEKLAAVIDGPRLRDTVVA